MLVAILSIFVADTKITFIYNFVATLNDVIVVIKKSDGICSLTFVVDGISELLFKLIIFFH